MMSNCLYCYKPLDKQASGDFHVACSMKFFRTKTPPIFDYSLAQMKDLAKDVVERSVTVPGVQPKLSLTIVNEASENGRKKRLTIVGALGGNFILKPPSSNYPEMPQNEHATMRIAEEAFGMRTVPSSLIRLQSGELAYITKRIDRTDDGDKIHMLDMFQILEAFDKYKSSMERVGKAINTYSANTLLDLLYYFELTMFSFLTGNNDMHLKNFSMINDGSDWTLAPAYDLLNVHIANPDDNEELALTLNGKKRKLKLEHFIEFGLGLGLNERQIQNTFNRFKNKKDVAFKWLDNSFLSNEYKIYYKDIMSERYSILKM